MSYYGKDTDRQFVGGRSLAFKIKLPKFDFHATHMNFFSTANNGDKQGMPLVCD